MRDLWRSMMLLWPLKGALLVFLALSSLEGVFTTTYLVIGKAWLMRLEGKSLDIKNDIAAKLNHFLTTQFGDGADYVYGLAVVILTLLIFKGACSFFASYLQGWISQKIAVDTQVKVMHHLLGMDIGYFDRRKIGDLVNRMTVDTRRLRRTAKLTLDVLEKPPIITILVTYALMTNWKLFLLGAIGVPIIIYPLIAITRRIYRFAKKARAQDSEITQEMLEDLSGMRTVQAYGAVEVESRGFEAMSNRYFKYLMKRAASSAMQGPVSEVVLGLGALMVIVYGSLQVLNSHASAQDLLVFLGTLGLLQSPIRGMLSSLGEIPEFLPSARRSFEILEQKPSIVDGPNAVDCPPVSGEIVFENVTFDYGRGPVFSNLNLTIKAGESVGIVGRTGIGKSTLLSLLLRFYEPTEGRITIDGVDLKDIKVESLRRHIAFVSQEPFLFHTTIEENIRYGKLDATKQEVEEAARGAAIHEEIAGLPEKYETVVGLRGTQLSGGQRQRVAIARAMVRDAPILLLDEATSALDSTSEQTIQRALEKLAEGRTSLIIAHRLSTLRMTDRIVVFGEAGIEAVDTHENLLKVSETYQRLWGDQTSDYRTEPGEGKAIVEGKGDADAGEKPRRPADAPRRKEDRGEAPPAEKPDGEADAPPLPA